MKIINKIILLIAILIVEETNAQNLKIEYPDTSYPSLKPQIFAENLVSTTEHEFSCCFSPSGDEFYFTQAVGNNKKKSILVIKYDGKRWNKPEKALPNFIGETYEPYITPDGEKLYFMGMLVNEKNGERVVTMDLYYAERENSSWSKITHLQEPFNPSNCMFVSSSVDNFLFTTNRSGEGPDIVYVKTESGKYSNYLNPGRTINTDNQELYPFVAIDGSYLLFNRYVGKKKFLFVSFKQKDGSWGESFQVPLGMESGCPMVSPDGKFLFFNSGERFLNDIYWVSSEVFLSLKPKK